MDENANWLRCLPRCPRLFGDPVAVIVHTAAVTCGCFAQLEGLGREIGHGAERVTRVKRDTCTRARRAGGLTDALVAPRALARIAVGVKRRFRSVRNSSSRLR